MRILTFLVSAIILFSSCSSYQATVKKHKNLKFESVEVYPEWTPKKPKGKWILPVISLSGGAYYGYKTEFTYEDKTYEGKENAAIWGGIGLIGGALLTNLIFQKKPYNSYKYNPADSEKWLRNYNKTNRTNYVLHKTNPNQSLVIVPRNRLKDMAKLDQAIIDRETARVRAEEDRIRIAQEDRRRRQQEEISREEQRRNLVKYMDWEPITITGEKDVYPSAVIAATSFNNYAGNNGDAARIANFLGFHFKPQVAGATLTYEIESSDNRFLAKSTGRIRVDGTGKQFPDLNWKMDDLLANKTMKPLVVTFRLKDESNNYVEKKLSLNVASINECIMHIGKNNTDWILPAYANEQHPLIEGVLKEALDKGYVDAFTGYQGTRMEVLIQVKAIWDVLSDRGFKYSSVTGAGKYDSKNIYTQYIRTTGDALSGEQANCIDGSLLFAAILKRIGINPYILMPPGHAFLGFDLDKSKRKIGYLEVTLVGASSFEYAISKGMKAYKETPLLDKRIIDIGLSRKAGVRPLGN